MSRRSTRVKSKNGSSSSNIDDSFLCPPTSPPNPVTVNHDHSVYYWYTIIQFHPFSSRLCCWSTRQDVWIWNTYLSPCGEFIRLARHPKFPMKDVFKVDVSALGDDFFKPDFDLKLVNPPNDGPPPNTGNFRSTMLWDPVSDTAKSTNQSILTNSFFLYLVDTALQIIAGKPQPLSTDNAIDLHDVVLYGGFLKTVIEKLQEPHIDERHVTLKKYKQKLRGEYSFAPYSLDMPLTDDGMRLCLYGSHPQGTGKRALKLAIKEGTLLETPVMVYIHLKEALLFR